MARQCDLILMHILKYGSITHLEAVVEDTRERFKRGEYDD